MFTRQIGPWRIEAGMAEGYEQAWNEDGPYTRRVPYLLVQAVHQRGEIYICSCLFKDEAEAAATVKQFKDDWTPQTCTYADFWNFDRNVYGSKAYQDNWHQEEYNRMDYQERRGHGYAG